MSTITKEKCPVEAVSAIISRKWVCLILRDLEGGPKRFGELEHSVKASPASFCALTGTGSRGVDQPASFCRDPSTHRISVDRQGKAAHPCDPFHARSGQGIYIEVHCKAIKPGDPGFFVKSQFSP